MKRPGLLRLSAAIGALAGAIAGAQECPDVQRDLCPPAPAPLCGVPTNQRCTCLSCATHECVYFPRDCDDRDPCTVDYCDDNVGCLHVPFCEDGDPCTEATCVVLDVPFLPDVVICEPRPSPCDDGRVCNGIEVCAPQGGPVCEPGTPIDCDDHDGCTADRCDEDLGGCEHEPLPCDDGNACTDDVCDPAAGCTHSPIVGCCETDPGCDDGDPCTVDRCTGGRCASEPVPGVGALVCVCQRPQPAACATVIQPRPLVRARRKACVLLSHLGATATSRVVTKALHFWSAGARVARRPKVRERLGSCADALAAAYEDAADRARGLAAPAGG